MLPPAIDYTNKDYSSLRRAMLDLARYRVPEWTDHSPSDLGVLLIELFAYMGDIVLYYQDRIASESFLHTAVERRSVINHLRLIGYEPRSATPASALLNLTFNPPPQNDNTPVTIPRGTQFLSKGNASGTQTYEYLGVDRQVDLRSDQVTPGPNNKLVYSGLPVVHGKTVDLELIGSSTGEPNQMFRLAQTPLLTETVEVDVDEGAGFRPWTRRDHLLFYYDEAGKVTLAGPTSRDFQVRLDEDGVGWVVFGDRVYGMVPPNGTNNIRARYRAGGGSAGNVPAGSITDVAEAKRRVRLLDAATNPAAATGGTDVESSEHAVRFGPLAFRSGSRAVTLNDFISLAHQAGGVAKAWARSKGWNQVDLFIAPDGDTLTQPSEPFKERLRDYFEDKRMVGTFVEIHGARAAPVNVSVTVVVEHNFDREVIRLAVQNGIRSLFSFQSVEFGQPVYLSKIYELAESIAGVAAATVTRFRRDDKRSKRLDELIELRRLAGRSATAFLRYLTEVEPDGRIELDEDEIPTLNELEIELEGSGR